MYTLHRLALALVLFVTATAQAETVLELSVGQAFATAQRDGNWYQKRFDHELDLESPTASVNLRTDLSPRWALNTGAYWIGQNRSHALAVTHDDLYSKSSPTGCPGECPALATFIGHGYSWGVHALVELHTTGRTQWGVMAGPIAYRASWTETVPDWFPTAPDGAGGFTSGDAHPVHLKESRWLWSGAVGVRVSRGRTFAEVIHYLDGQSIGKDHYFPPIWDSHTAARIGFTF